MNYSLLKTKNSTLMNKAFRSKYFISFLFISLFNLDVTCQEKWINEIRWEELAPGILYAELDAPEKSVVNDSKLTILKLDVNKLDFRFLTASENGNKPRTAPDWAKEFDMNIVVNAGMYNYNKTQSNKGYMKNYNHYNNENKSDYYNAIMAINPINKSEANFEIIDITCRSWEIVKNQFHSLCQGMRMISCNGEEMAFTKRPNQSCSMIVMSTDILGNIYIVFTRSPYTHQKMISFLKGLPMDLRTTVYLEGGVESSLYINTADTTIAKFGSYVSNTRANDKNDHFWKIPNTIGIKLKN